MMNKKSVLNRFFSNDIVLLVTSVILAFVIWFVINANSQVDGTKTIQNIPITIELSQEAIDDGLEVFGLDDQTASVEVTGNRLTVGSLDADDIKVYAYQSNTIIAPASYTLSLEAKKNSVKTNYNFASNVSPNAVTVFVDRRKDKEFTIVDEVVYKVDEGYYANSSLSENVIKISGPETEVSAIEQVVIRGSIEGSVKDTVTEELDLVFLDANGEEKAVKMSELSTDSVKVSLTAIPTKEVELTLDVLNEPAVHPDIKIKPSKISIAAEQSVLDEIGSDSISIGTLDFSMLSNKKNSLEFDITLPNGCKNLSDSLVADVTIDLSNYKTKTLTLSDFTFENLDTAYYSVELTNNSVDVKLCGPETSIAEVEASDIICQIDFTDKIGDDLKDSGSASLELPITFEIKKKFSRCFVEGNYTAQATITLKTSG